VTRNYNTGNIMPFEIIDQPICKEIPKKTLAYKFYRKAHRAIQKASTNRGFLGKAQISAIKKKICKDTIANRRKAKERRKNPRKRNIF
jgi:hypothetical protein